MTASNKIRIKYKLFFKNLINISSQPLYQIIGIFLLALAIRTFALGSFPVGFHVDEVKVGWNSLSILKTLKDDHLNLLPLYYNTFGDYRPTGIFYLSIPSMIIFGKSIFAVRFTSALFGALSVFPIYLIGNMLFNKNKNIGLLSALVLCVSPWNIEVSRATSEVVISSFFVLTTIYYFLKLIEEEKNKYLYLSFASILVSHSLYHSARLLIPIYLLVIAVYYLNRLNRKSMIVIGLSIITTFILILSSSTSQRFKQVSLFNSENVKYELQKSNESKIIVYTRSIIKEYGHYFSSDFLIGESARPYRYLTLGVGLLNYVDLYLLLLGIYLLIKGNKNWILILLLILSPIPAVLTIEDTPNLHRAFYMMPFIALIEGYAISMVKNKKVLAYLFVFSFAYFSYAYFFKSNMHLPYQKNLYIDSPTYRNIGNIELSNKIERYKNNYDLIYVTNFPDNLYPWYAFFNINNPKDFNQKTFVENSNERKYENIIFTDTRCPSDYAFNNGSNNILVVDSGECAVESKINNNLKAKIFEEIKRTDGSVVYYLISNQK